MTTARDSHRLCPGSLSQRALPNQPHWQGGSASPLTLNSHESHFAAQGDETVDLGVLEAPVLDGEPAPADGRGEREELGV